MLSLWFTPKFSDNFSLADFSEMLQFILIEFLVLRILFVLIIIGQMRVLRRDSG